MTAGRRELPPAARRNCLRAIQYAIEAAEVIYRAGNRQFLGEILLSLARDIYFYQRGEYPRDTVLAALDLTGPALDESEKSLVRALEKSMRKEKSYNETVEAMDIAGIRRIIEKFKKHVNTWEAQS